MERISIFNYEAYLLDLIEGTISESDKALLLAFLQDHPELDVDWNDLPSLTLQDTALDSRFKNSLKITDTEEDSLSSETIESYLLAQTEGLLSKEKEEELMAFLAEYPEYLSLQEKYAAAHLKADEKIVFGNKEELKQKATLVFWPYWAAAAAVVLTLLFFMNSNRVDNTPQMAQDHKESKQAVPNIEKLEKPEEQNVIQNEMNIAHKDQPKELRSADNLSNEMRGNKIENVSERDVPQLALQPVNTLKSISGNGLEKEAFKETPPIYSIENNVQESDVAVVDFNDMSNPIKPLTKRLSNVTNTEMDLRMAKANDTQTGGFYFKLGKVEVSRRTYR